MPEPLPPDAEKKVQFVVEEAHARLDSTLSAYDSISSKAAGLLSVAVPVITGLGAYCILQFDPGSPLFYAAVLYAVLLGVGTWPLWKIVTGGYLVHRGRSPSDYLDVEEFKTATLTEMWLKLCHFYEADIAKNEAVVEKSALRLRTALLVFGAATAASLAALALGSTVQHFAALECRRFPPAPPRSHQEIEPAF